MSDPVGPEQGRVHVVGWGWGRDADERPGLPWIGIFLVIFGGLLLLQQIAPEFRQAGSLFFLAVGVAFLISWAANRRTSALYVGGIVTAIALSDVLSQAGYISGDGWGTLFLGIAFILIGLIRAGGRGGWGWQFIFGGLLVVSGGSSVAAHVAGFPEIGRYAWPVLLLVVGIALLLRGSRRRSWG
jgi:hypothetical protein